MLQLSACLVLKTFLKTDYRGLVAWLQDCPDLCRAISVTAVPHFTTFHKASGHLLRLPSACRLLVQTLCMALKRKRILLTAIDSTGLEAGYSSYYFVRRRHKQLPDYKNMYYANYLKRTILCDYRIHLILTAGTLRGSCSDVHGLIPILQTVPAGVAIDTLVADAGYDSEGNHTCARDQRGIQTWNVF